AFSPVDDPRIPGDEVRGKAGGAFAPRAAEMAEYVILRVRDPARRDVRRKGSTDLAGGVILMLRDRGDRERDAGIEGDDALRVAGAQGPGEACEIRRLGVAVHLVWEVGPIDPPAPDLVAPAHRPLADDRFPVPLKLGKA